MPPALTSVVGVLLSDRPRSGLLRKRRIQRNQRLVQRRSGARPADAASGQSALGLERPEAVRRSAEHGERDSSVAYFPIRKPVQAAIDATCEIREIVPIGVIVQTSILPVPDGAGALPWVAQNEIGVLFEVGCMGEAERCECAGA